MTARRIPVDTDATMAANSDSRIASQKAVKTALATKQADLGVTLDTDVTLAANSDTRVPSQKAVKTAIANSGSLTVLPTGDTTGVADVAAIAAALATGKPVNLMPGATYYQRQKLTLASAGQVLNGNGAALKRVAQATTTTTTSVTSGVTSSITVADASGFKVGDQIVLSNGATYGLSAKTIASIVGNVITITGTFSVTVSGTTNVYQGYRQIEMTAANCRVTNLELDGNSANWTWGRWNHTAGVWSTTGSDGGMVDHCYIHHQYGDGATPGDYQTFWFAFNRVENIKGRGISWAASANAYGGRCLYNRFYNCDLDTAVAASDGKGCIQLSSNQQDLLIHGNSCENGVEGIGSINSTGNSDITITDNVIRTMSSYAIEADCPSGDGASNVVIANNRIYDSVAVYINQQASGSTTFPARWLIKGNIFSNTAITGNYAQKVLIEGNTFTGGGTTLAYINVSASAELTIVGNRFGAGNYALSIGGAFSNLIFRNNTCTNQHTRAVNIYGTGCTLANVISDNTITNDATAVSGYDGISIVAGQDKISVKDNEITLVGGNSGMTISANYCVVMGNTIRCGTAPKSIRIAPVGATSNWVGYNTTDVAVSDAGTTTTLVSNAAIT